MHKGDYATKDYPCRKSGRKIGRNHSHASEQGQQKAIMGSRRLEVFRRRHEKVVFSLK
jgi:hypothetical protein